MKAIRNPNNLAKARAMQLAYRVNFARQYGLPDECSPVMVRIVLALTTGPKTKPEISEFCLHGKNESIKPYLAKLRAIGLVVNRRFQRGLAIYFLTPYCLELLIQKGSNDDTR